MIHANSSSNRDVDTDDEQLRDTNAENLNKANTQDRTGAFGATSGGSPYTSSAKSETIIVKPQGVKDGD